VLEEYRPEFYREIRAFARKLGAFFYVRMIIDAHARNVWPGRCCVWREDGKLVAFSAVAYLNRDDAWLWGMRVDSRFQNRGIATRFTRALFPLVRKAGRTWAGLNTLDRRGTAPTFRVMDKLGMRLEDVFATDVYWRRPRNLARPRLRPCKDIFRHYVKLGRRTIFRQRMGWFYSRLLPARRACVNAGGFLLDGVPVHLNRNSHVERGRLYRDVVVNLFDRPADFRAFVPRLLALIPKTRGRMAVNYPVEWRREFRAGARTALPRLRQDHGAWFSAWRIYGRHLRRRPGSKQR